MEPFVVDDGWPDRISGRLFDTGEDYPAAVLDTGAADVNGDADAPRREVTTIAGRTFALLEASAARAIEVLDEVEGVVDGEYRRVPITTASGTRAWVYEFGGGLDLTPIDSGDWLAHRPPHEARPLAD